MSFDEFGGGGRTQSGFAAAVPFDSHLQQSGGMADLQLEDGSHTPMPLLPLSLDGQRLQPRRAIARIGEHTRQVMRELGYSDAHIAELCAAGVLKTDDAA